MDSASAASVVPRCSRWARNLAPNTRFELIDICQLSAAAQPERAGHTSKWCMTMQLRPTFTVTDFGKKTSAPGGEQKGNDDLTFWQRPVFWCAPYVVVRRRQVRGALSPRWPTD